MALFSVSRATAAKQEMLWMRVPWWSPWKRHAVDADVTALVTVMCVLLLGPSSVRVFLRDRSQHPEGKTPQVFWFLRLSSFFSFFFFQKTHQCTRLLPRSGRHRSFVVKETGIVVFILFFYTAATW